MSDLTDAWLAFFCALKIPVVISPKRYRINNHGDLFMPHFELPTFHLFVHVVPEATDEIIEVCQEFCWAFGAIFLGVGLPGSPDNRLFCWDTTDSSGGTIDHERVQLWASDDSKILFMLEDQPHERSYWCDPAMSQELPVLRHYRGWARASVDGHDFEVPTGVLRSRGHDVLTTAISNARSWMT